MTAEDEDARASRHLVDVAATTDLDLYAALDLTATEYTSISPSDLNKAWRKAALKYHPDKNRGAEDAAADKLGECRKAYDVLKDPVARHKYDERKRVELERKKREGAYDAKRKQMIDDLQKGEREEKRRRTEGSVPNAEEAKLAMLRAKAAAMKQEMMAKKRRETEAAFKQEAEKDAPKKVSEFDRGVKIRWICVDNAAIDEKTLEARFSRFGPVDFILGFKEKRERPAGDSGAGDSKKSKKVLMGSATVIFKSVVGAHCAVLDVPRLVGEEPESWAWVDDVQWFKGKPLRLEAQEELEDEGFTLEEITLMRMKEAGLAQRKEREVGEEA